MSGARAVGIGLVLIVGLAVFLLGILAVAGLFFFRMAAPLAAPQAAVIETESIAADPIVQPKVAAPTPGEIERELAQPGNNNADFKLSVSSVSRKPDGTCAILVAAQRSGSTDDLVSFQLSKAEIVEPQLACFVASSPAGPPYRRPIDLMIRTPALPADLKKVRIRYVLHFETDGPQHPFRGMNDGFLEVTLPSPVAPDKAENKAEAGADDFPLQPAAK